MIQCSKHVASTTMYSIKIILNYNCRFDYQNALELVCGRVAGRDGGGADGHSTSRGGSALKQKVSHAAKGGSQRAARSRLFAATVCLIILLSYKKQLCVVETGLQSPCIS